MRANRKWWKKFELLDGSMVRFSLEHKDAADRFFLQNYGKIRGVTLNHGPEAETEEII